MDVRVPAIGVPPLLLLVAFSLALLLQERSFLRFAAWSQLPTSVINTVVLVSAVGLVLVASGCGGVGSGQTAGPQSGVHQGNTLSRLGRLRGPYLKRLL